MPVAMPDEASMVIFAVLLLLHVPPDVALSSVVVPERHTPDPVILAGSALTVTTAEVV